MSEISEKRLENMSEVASLDEAAELLRQLAGNRLADESIKAVLRRVGRRVVSWSPSRVRAVWYRDPRVKLRTGEVEQLRTLVDQREQNKADTDELAELRARISRLETLLERTDPSFHGPNLDALRRHRGEVG